MKKGQSQLLAKPDKRKYVKIREKLSLGKKQKTYMTYRGTVLKEPHHATPRHAHYQISPPCRLRWKLETLNAESIRKKALGKSDCILKAPVLLLQEHTTRTILRRNTPIHLSLLLCLVWNAINTTNKTSWTLSEKAQTNPNQPHTPKNTTH